MLLTTCALAAGLSLAPVPPAVQYFPGDYYNRHGHVAVEGTALDRWPGPTGLLVLWRSGTLSTTQRVALLLGGGAFHDPQLLPAYREALLDPSPRIRSAAAFGLHVLLADGIPGGDDTIDPESGRDLSETVTELEQAFRSRDLVQVWLESLLHTEGTALFARPGLRFVRDLRVCEHALDTLLEPEDLPLLLVAYRTARTTTVRTSLMRLLSGLSMKEFVPKVRGPRTGWNSEIFRIALRRADALADRWCNPDPRTVYIHRLRDLHVRGVEPFDASAGGVWLRILQKAPPPWWGVAGRMLYRNGAPPFFPSLRDPESPASRSSREALLRFYGLMHTRKVRLVLPGDRSSPTP